MMLFIYNSIVGFCWTVLVQLALGLWTHVENWFSSQRLSHPTAPRQSQSTYPKYYINTEKEMLRIATWANKNGVLSGRLSCKWTIPQILRITSIYITGLIFSGQFRMHFHQKKLKGKENIPCYFVCQNVSQKFSVYNTWDI